MPGLGEGCHLGMVGLVDVVKGNPGNDLPETAVLIHHQGGRSSLDAVLHQVLGQVMPRAGDIVVAAPLAAVDFKDLELPVPRRSYFTSKFRKSR